MYSGLFLYFLSSNVISFLFFFLVISRSEILEEKKVADCLKILEDKKKAKRLYLLRSMR